jgi:VWFA-related protein
MYALAADPRRRVFVIYLDRLHTRIEGSSAVRTTLANALERLIGPDDLFAVMTPDMRPRDLAFGRKTVSIAEQLQRVWTWGTRGEDRRDQNDPVEYGLWACFHNRMERPDGRIVEWLVPDGGERRFLDELLIERRREDRVLTNLEALVGHLGSLREARTVLLTITDGWRVFDRDLSLVREPEKDIRASAENLRAGTFSNFQRGGALENGDDFGACIAELQRLADLDNAPRFRDVMSAANRANVSFYPLAASGLAALDGGAGAQRMIPNPNAPPGRTVMSEQLSRVTDRVQGLREIAENTDGIAVVDTNDTATGFARIVDDVSSYYLIGYRSTDDRRDTRFRRIEVRTSVPGLHVRARRGYVAARPESVNVGGAGAPTAGAAAAVPAEVEGALGGLAEVRESADLFVRGAVRPGKVVVAVELSSAQLTSGTWTQGGGLQIELRTAAGERVGAAETKLPAGARGTSIEVPVTGASGPLRARAVLTAGRTAVDEVAEVQPWGGDLVDAPLLFRATPSPRSPLRPVADPRFRRVERVHVEWPARGTLSGATVRVLDRRGQPLKVGATVAQLDRTAGPVVAADVNLAPLAEGDYLVEVTVRGSDGEERHLVAFRVVR